MNIQAIEMDQIQSNLEKCKGDAALLDTQSSGSGPESETAALTDLASEVSDAEAESASMASLFKTFQPLTMQKSSSHEIKVRENTFEKVSEKLLI